MDYFNALKQIIARVSVPVALLVLGSLGTGVALAVTQFPPGALLQPNDVTSSHIRDNTIVNADVSTSAAIEPLKIKGGTSSGSLFYDGGSTLATSSSLTWLPNTTGLGVTGTTTLTGTTTIDGVSYNWPNADGSNGQNLTTNGSGQLSWATPSASNLFSSFTAGEAITAGDAVYVKSYQSGGAIAIDTSSSGETAGGSVSSSITIGSNSNRMLLCGIATQQNNDPTSVQYNGTNMTLLDSRSAQTGDNKVRVYYQLAPTTGAHNFTFTNNDPYVAWACFSVYNVSQSTGPYTTTYAPASSAFSQSTTTIAAGYDIFTLVNKGGSFGTWTNVNNRQAQDNASNTFFVMGNTTPASSAVSTTTSETGGSNFHSAIHVQIAPANPFIGAVFRADADLAATVNAFIGFSPSAISQDSTGTVYIAGTVTGFSNLTIGTQYYVSNTTGGISSSAGTVSRKACIAVSTSSCLITNIW